jgi:MFS family permease
LLILPLPLTAALLAPWAGRLADRRGSRLPCTAGMGLVALAGLGLWAVQLRAGAAVSWWVPAGGLLLMGAGMGLNQSPVTAAVTHMVPPEKTGTATGVFHMGRFVSGSLGTTVLALLLQAPAGMAAGFRHGLLLVAVVAGLAVLAALRLPGRGE